MVSSEKYIVYLSLGSNVGNRGDNLRRAIIRIIRICGVKLLSASVIYETKPWGLLEQNDFFNMVIKISYSKNKTPYDLLSELKNIEKEMGRIKNIKWGPRIIDIDIIHIENVNIINDAQLTLPHPHMWDREFVLKPLADINPNLIVNGNNVLERLSCIIDDSTRAIKVNEQTNPFNIRFIACVDEGNGIGYNGKLIYDIPADMKFFKEKTNGNIVIMGRFTQESLNNNLPLSNRINIVLSTKLEEINGFVTIRKLSDLWLYLSEINPNNDREIWCIGGSECYSNLLPYTHEGFITRIKGKSLADRFFPTLDEFEIKEMIYYYGLSIEHYRRIKYEKTDF